MVYTQGAAFFVDRGQLMDAISKKIMIGLLILLPAGCHQPTKPPQSESPYARAEDHQLRWGQFSPKKLGTVANIGLQLPAVSPDGQYMLYLRGQAPFLSPMSLLGSPDLRHTPAEGTLSVWLRPTEGTGFGQQVSTERYAHSPTWSSTGRAAVYVVNDPPLSYLVHVNMADGSHTRMGLPGAINCQPRFAGDDTTLLFCAGPTVGELAVYRQAVGGDPERLTPQQGPFYFPLIADGRQVVCGQIAGDTLQLAQADTAGSTPLFEQVHSAALPSLPTFLAGIGDPLSPDGQFILFYNDLRSRVGVGRLKSGRVFYHRSGSMAACWLDGENIALVTTDYLFAIQADTGISLTLMNGAWLPRRYVERERRLILLGRDEKARDRLTVWELVFDPPGRTVEHNTRIIERDMP